MIHQFIYAAPKPGMTEQAFQDYWVNVHAVNYASKIPQIRKYLIDTRIALPGETGEAPWSGVAEIWLKDEKEQLESLQTPEFLKGAREDEPNWAAFWKTVVLDTTAHELFGDTTENQQDPRVKLLVLSKRKEGFPLENFRSYFLGAHAAKVSELPGLRRYAQGHVRDGAYAIGEAVLDCVEQFWFDSVDAALLAQSSVQQEIVNASYQMSTEARSIHKMLTQAHWVIGPEARAYVEPGVAVS